MQTVIMIDMRRNANDWLIVMEIIRLACPCCGANLPVEDDDEVFYCKHCGSRLVVEGAENRRKAKLRLQEMQHEERMWQSELEHEERMQREKHKHELRQKFTPLAASMFLFLLCFAMIHGSSIPHSLKVRELKRIEQTVISDIEEGKYDEALLQANRLRLDDGYSGSETKSWNEKRNSYIATITELKKKTEASNPDYQYAPSSSKDLEGMKREQVADLFERAGFTNIEYVSIADDSGFLGFFKKTGEVEHVVFGGKTEFTTEDMARKDEKVVIYYYEDTETEDKSE